MSEYADHVPLYRRAQILARQGVNIDRSTLADWVGRAALLLRPVHVRLIAILKTSPKLFADEMSDFEWSIIEPLLPNNASGRAPRRWPDGVQWYLPAAPDRIAVADIPEC